ncbi:MAG TPA: protein kinase [Candidatus Angelobacter sp.]|jgi:serine/threonine protein kinase/tetratricopeptide (TPR) repeat protein
MDTAERDDRVMTIAAEALQKPLAERGSFLRAACQNDSDLYQEVSEVVTWEERMSTFLRRPLIDLIDIDSLDKPFESQQKVADRFDIIREIGDGGMGVVYEAYDNTREQRIAIKCAKPGFSRLQSPELNGALKVRHPNVCQLNDIHMTSTDLGEVRFITMELLGGETLQSRLLHGRLTPDEAMKIARQLCAGVAEAHRCGVVHGDLKPANIILTRGERNEIRAVITDFGLSVNQDANSGLLGGTPSYMAPELKTGGRVSTASDVYALGVILYEMATGQKPFPAANTAKGDAPVPATPDKLIKPVPPSKLVKNLSGIWDDAILPCLSPRPEKRPSVTQTLAVLNRKPLYLRPWVARTVIAALLLFTVGMMSWPKIKSIFWPDIRLAILPVQAPATDLVEQGSGILMDVSERIKHLQKTATTISVILPSITKNEEVTTPEQAARVLHATHALQLKLSRQGKDVVVEQSLVELAQQTQVGAFRGQYSPQLIGDIPAALTGAVSSALHLARAKGSDEILPEATAAYDRGLADLARDTYSYDDAIKSFEEAVAQDPHSPLPLAGLADAQLQKFDATKKDAWLDQAKDSLQKAEHLNPDSVRVLLTAGYRSLKEGRYSAAMDYYNRILETEPRNIQALSYRGFTLAAENKEQDAIRSFTRAIDQDRKLYSSYEDFGSFYFNLGRYPEAEEQFRKGIEIAGRPDAYANLGAVLLDDCKFVEAKKELERVPENKRTPQTLNNLGAVYAYIRKDDLAVDEYKEAIQQEGGNALYRLNIGDSWRRLGKLEDAMSAYREGLRLVEKQLELNPQHAQALAYRAYFRARLKIEGAKDDANAALTLWPNDSEVIRYAFLAYVALRDKEAALSTYKKGNSNVQKQLELHPDVAELRKDLRFSN